MSIKGIGNSRVHRKIMTGEELVKGVFLYEKLDMEEHPSRGKGKVAVYGGNNGSTNDVEKC